jgi:deoxyribodipyrimidine photo-lyase
MSHQSPVIAWFRQDLRITDNPALSAAAETGQPVLPVYILDDVNAGEFCMGAASRWWLHNSLLKLNDSLDNHLLVYRGDAHKVIADLIEQSGATAVYWNRCYEPWRIARDRKIKTALRESGITADSFGGSLLFEPQSVTKPDGTPYRVFTPFYRKGCLQNAPAPRTPLPAPAGVQWATLAADSIDSLELMPAIHWYENMAATWSPGEEGAQERLEHFVAKGLQNYKEGRNRPDQNFVSRLSPHLHFGELSPNQAWYAADSSAVPTADIDHFQSELGWREFSHYLLYHFPELPRTNLQSKFDRFPWRDDEAALRRWQKGRTGYPIVDAGMRELWQTGYMHNRVRMIVGSFLVKNLMLHWHHGEAWFWDTLVDADLANNSASWQWIAGCGADAAPYFRIFNPVTQGLKFDPNGDYVRRYVPELSDLAPKHLHEPWNAPEDVLHDAGVRLGETYPTPIVDLKASRERALAAFQGLGKTAA